MTSRRQGRSAAPGWRRAALAVVAAIALMAAPAALRADPGPVPSENAQPGTPGWYAPTAPQPSEADQYAGRVASIDGWAWPLSAEPGDTVDLHVGTASGVRYRVEVYRLGWYGGDGARLKACLPSCSSDRAGVVQPLPPAPDPTTGEVRSGWSATDTLSIPASWPSGFYVAALTITAGEGVGSVRRVPFVVRESASESSKIVVVVPVNTWQAYNGWGGKALYDNHSADGVRASQVSFERPWMEGVEISNWRYSEYPLTRFLERNDLDVSYVTDLDVAQTPGILAGHPVVMVSGHGEYWTHEERDAFEAARDAGQSLAFMGANIGYWQVRYANGGRSMIGYKSAADPIADPALKTDLFRNVGRPECTLLGVQYNASSWGLGTSADLGVVDASLGDPWFAGAGFTPGGTVPETMGYEWDQITPGCATPPLTPLFHWQAEGWPVADAARYTAPSGAKVFAAGSLQFSWGLDGWRFSDVVAAPDARLEAFTMRMLVDMGGAGGGPAQPSVTISPQAATVQAGSSRQFSASLQNASGGVQWSVDGVAGGDASVGTVSASGLYTAPAAVPAAKAVSVRATHLASGASDAATVTITAAPEPSVTVSPQAATVQVGSSRQFSASLQNASGGVQWSVDGVAGGDASVGTVSASGLYTAPAAVPAAKAVSVRATHLASGASDAATVVVTAPPPPPPPPPPAADPAPPAVDGGTTPGAPVTPAPPVIPRPPVRAASRPRPASSGLAIRFDRGHRRLTVGIRGAGRSTVVRVGARRVRLHAGRVVVRGVRPGRILLRVSGTRRRAVAFHITVPRHGRVRVVRLR